MTYLKRWQRLMFVMSFSMRQFSLSAFSDLGGGLTGNRQAWCTPTHCHQCESPLVFVTVCISTQDSVVSAGRDRSVILLYGGYRGCLPITYAVLIIAKRQNPPMQNFIWINAWCRRHFVKIVNNKMGKDCSIVIMLNKHRKEKLNKNQINSLSPQMLRS